jgi:peptidoglycan-associated lipoprotein
MRFKFLPIVALALLVAACTKDKVDSTTPSGSGSGSNGGGGPTTQGTTITPGSLADFNTNVGNMVFFDFDKSDLTPDARATLDRQAAWLKQYSSVALVVEGHADERGTREYNLALGERRATAVKNYLAANGVPASRLKTISYGKERPLELGSNEAAWAKNRRGVSVPQNVPQS